jgi:hypothetical protein
VTEASLAWLTQLAQENAAADLATAESALLTARLARPRHRCFMIAEPGQGYSLTGFRDHEAPAASTGRIGSAGGRQAG